MQFWATACKTVHRMLSDRCLSVCLSCLSVTLVYCGQTVGWIKIKLGNAGGPRPWSHCVRLKPSSPSPKGGRSPQFSAHICCGQMAGCIKMPLGMEEGLIPGNFVLDGDPAPSTERGRSPSPIFGLCPLWPNGWTDQDGT